MTIQQIYELAITMGIKADPRGEKTVNKSLERTKKEYQELSEKKKNFFDVESLTNPYADSRIYFGDPKTEVKKILAGIDADGNEVLLADRLNEKGEGIDLLISHHPEGHGYAGLNDVLEMQVDMHAAAGIPINIVDALMADRKTEIARRIHPANHTQVVDTARLLKIPFMSLHTIWDNMGDQFLRNHFKGKEFETVGEVYETLMEIPEFIEAKKGKAGPMIVSGNEKSRVGKIEFFFTGGTNPSKEVYIELAKAGVGTLIDMHIPEEALKELRKLHVNVISTGHMSGDSIGGNLFFDELEKQGIEVIPCSGFIRVKRKGGKN